MCCWGHFRTRTGELHLQLDEKCGNTRVQFLVQFCAHTLGKHLSRTNINSNNNNHKPKHICIHKTPCISSFLISFWADFGVGHVLCSCTNGSTMLSKHKAPRYAVANLHLLSLFDGVRATLARARLFWLSGGIVAEWIFLFGFHCVCICIRRFGHTQISIMCNGT